eukprot:GAHX01000348.1.p1 GENE.GAHX01000348.1~~GAHX01000348.1.p1  ORF type:complete len:527 (+),score=111.85 GAHX01000348.1:36-1583(+)
MTSSHQTTEELLIKEREARHNLEVSKHTEVIRQILSLNKDNDKFLVFAINLCKRHNAFPASITLVLDTLFAAFESDPSGRICHLEAVISITEGKLIFEQQYNRCLTLLFHFHLNLYNSNKKVSNLQEAIRNLERIKLDNFTDQNYTFQLTTILNNFKALIILALSSINKKMPVDNSVIHKLALINRKTRLLNIRTAQTEPETIVDIKKCYFYFSAIHILNNHILKNNNKQGMDRENCNIEFDKFANLNLNELDLNRDINIKHHNNGEEEHFEAEDEERIGFVALAENILELHEKTNDQTLFFLAVCFSLAGNSTKRKDSFIARLRTTYRNCLANFVITSEQGVNENLDSLLGNLNDRDLVYFDNSNLKELFSTSANSRLKEAEGSNSLILGETNKESLSAILSQLYDLAKKELRKVVAEYNIHILKRNVDKISISSFACICCLNDVKEAEELIKRLIKTRKLSGSINSITQFVYFEKTGDRGNESRMETVNDMIDNVEQVSSLIEKEYFKIRVGL